MAERAGATITEVAGSHVSMVSHPEVTIAAILARRGGGRLTRAPVTATSSAA